MNPERIQEANDALTILKEKNFQNASNDEILNAAKGIYYDEELSKKSMSYLLDELKTAAENNDELGIHPDSVTAHKNYAAAKYGLTIKDIQELKEGDTLDLILFCRNTGDIAHGTQKGHRWDSLLEGLRETTCYSPAKYTHKGGMRGDLELGGVSTVHENWEWELNAVRAPIPSRRKYWSPLNYQYPDEFVQDHPKTDVLEWNMFDPNTRVGWRGPCVRVQDLEKFPVQHVTHYDNFWNDYGLVEFYDMTDLK